MKKNVLSILLVFVMVFFTNYQIQAQDSTKTLFKSSFKNPLKSVKYLGYYLAPEYQFLNNNGTFNSAAGLSFLLIVNKRLAFGPSMVSTFSNSNNLIYGGLKTEYIIKPDGLFHISIPLIIGFGSTSRNFDNNFRPDFENQSGQIPQFGRPMRDRNQEINGPRMGRGNFLLQPGINGELNISKHIKFFAGTSYRLFPVINIENRDQNIENNLTNGVSFSGGFKVGLFDHKIKK